jgi:hypothetical protein
MRRSRSTICRVTITRRRLAPTAHAHPRPRHRPGEALGPTIRVRCDLAGYPFVDVRWPNREESHFNRLAASDKGTLAVIKSS